MSNSNANLELSVLGAALNWGMVELKDEVEAIRTEDFQKSFITSLFTKAKKYNFNPALVIANLETDEKAIFVAACEQAPFISHFTAELAMLKDKAHKRKLREFLTDYVMLPDDAMHEEELKTFLEAANDGDYFGDTYVNTARYIDEFINNLDKKPDTILTGFTALDSLTGGFRLPSVCIIGAYPSVGKTTFSLNIAIKAISRQYKVQIFSLEMSREMIFERLVGCEADINCEIISQRKLSKQEKQRAESTLNWLKKGNLSVVDDIYNIENIAVSVRRSKPKLVIIDYIQKVTTLQKFGNTREQINYISGEIKRIAKDSSCCVIALSQLSRAGKDAPTMTSLKESGSLEADGDYVILLHRPYVLDKSKKETINQLHVLVDKNKFGRTGKSEFYFNVETQRISKENNHYE